MDEYIKRYCKICKETKDFVVCEDGRALCSGCGCFFSSVKEWKFVQNQFGMYIEYKDWDEDKPQTESPIVGKSLVL